MSNKVHLTGDSHSHIILIATLEKCNILAKGGVHKIIADSCSLSNEVPVMIET